jgi:alpha-D-ribose 1-methylphosphonate 5-triphosphate diphosphatase
LAQALGPVLEQIAEMSTRIKQYDRQIQQLTQTEYPETQALLKVYGVGHITALTYVLTVGNKQRFQRSRDVGCYLGLRPRRSQSGDRDPQPGITKAGNVYLRSRLIECANHILLGGNLLPTSAITSKNQNNTFAKYRSADVSYFELAPTPLAVRTVVVFLLLIFYWHTTTEGIVISAELTLKNAKLITPSGVLEGAMHIRGGAVVDIHTGALDAPGIDLEGDYLIPGLVDLHTDNFDHHVRPRNNANWPVVPALLAHDSQMAAAGITTVCDSLYVGMNAGTRSFETLKSTIAALHCCRESGLLRAHHYLHLRAEISMEEMPEMFAAVYPNPTVRIVSVMDHTPGQRQSRDIEKYTDMMKKDYHRTQEQIDEILSTAPERHRRFSGPNRAWVIEMVAGHGITLASHDDTTVEHVEQAHAEGIVISEFPTTIEAAEAARARGMYIVAGSPNLVLGRSNSGNVSAEELARRGLLDALASDYVPTSMLHSVFLLHDKIGMPLPDAMGMISLRPARMIGLDDRGSIEPGKRADLVRVRHAHGFPHVVMVWCDGVRVA